MVAARGAYSLTRRAAAAGGAGGGRGNGRGFTPADAHKEAQALAQRVLRFGQAVRSAPVSPAEMNLGLWKPYTGTHIVSNEATMALYSRDARRAKTTSGAGQEPLSMAPMPEITLGVIADAQRLAHRTGWVNRKCDIDERYRRDDSHVKGIDRKLRAWCYKARCACGRAARLRCPGWWPLPFARRWTRSTGSRRRSGSWASWRARATPARSWCGATAFCPSPSAVVARSRCRARSSARWSKSTPQLRV